jgi:hypothetical protein
VTYEQDRGLELALFGDDRAHEFDEWVGRRLADWAPAQIFAFERWLLDEGQFEFVAAVREAWRQRASAA